MLVGSETIETGQPFARVQASRCLIPADSFFRVEGNARERQPFRVMLKSGEPFCFAGLWTGGSDRCRRQFDTDLDEAPPSEND